MVCFISQLYLPNPVTWLPSFLLSLPLTKYKHHLQLLQRHRRDTPLCIRFYDATEVSPAARYNTVTGPIGCGLDSNGIPENLYSKISSGSPQTNSDWLYGELF